MCNIKIYHSIFRELYINTRNYAISHKTLVNKFICLLLTLTLGTKYTTNTPGIQVKLKPTITYHDRHKLQNIKYNNSRSSQGENSIITACPKYQKFSCFFFMILIIHLTEKLQKYNFTEYFENQTDEQ